MHTHSIDRWAHDHVFLGSDHDRHERRTWLVVVLTATMMVAEIIGGNMFGSMAVVADGWHMSTHAAALSIAALSYRFARKHAHDPRFSFGTGKLGELAGFSSAIILHRRAVHRLRVRDAAPRPVPIQFGEATIVAAIGLAVNLLSAWLLFDDDHHHDAHDDEHAHGHDTNIRAAYLHVLADALTSVLAIVALLGGRFFNWVWLDPIMGIVGALFIAYLVPRADRLGRRGAARYRSKPESGCRDPRTSRVRGRPGERPSPVAPRSRAQRAHRDDHLAPSRAARVLQRATGGD